MPVTIDVRGDVALLSKQLDKIRRATPRVTSRAINELATWARKQAVDRTAEELRLPRPAVAKTRRRGAVRDRLSVTKSTPVYLVARVQAISDGIQVTDVAGAAINPWNVKGRSHSRKGGGVKAKGGRFYASAFKAPVAGGVRVFKRRSVGKLFLLRIGTRKTMLEMYQRHVAGSAGRQIFRDRFKRLAGLEIARAAG